MGANKDKQNLRYKITSQRLSKKVRYDGFTTEEVKIIKANKNYERYEKELNDFWKKVKRTDSGAADWNSLSELELDLFEYIEKQKKKYYNQISKAEDKGYDIDKIMELFMKLNICSASY